MSRMAFSRFVWHISRYFHVLHVTSHQKEAAKIMEDASKEVIGIIRNEAKDRVDEEQKKIAEEAKKQQDTANKKNADNESKAKNVADTNQLQFMNNLVTLVDRHQLLEEDIKGIVVDEQV